MKNPRRIRSDYDVKDGTTFGMFIQLVLLVVELSMVDCARAMEARAMPYKTKTKLGNVVGVRVTLNNKRLPEVDAFFGMKYATIRGGSLRFMPPSTITTKWEKTVNLSEWSACPQRRLDFEDLRKRIESSRLEELSRILLALNTDGFQMKEDCLTLNIFRPAMAERDATKLPVLVFVHGENYMYGSGDNYDGSVLAAVGKLVVVTVNYRLGILGFLSSADSNAPGNYALLDIIAALHWIQENIADFKGDRSNVTVMGQGHGAAMVNLLLVSPVLNRKDLFHRVILQSGSALSSWAIAKDPRYYAKHVGKKFNCTITNTAALISCLKSKDFSDLVQTNIDNYKYLSSFGPVLDHRSLFPDNLNTLFQKETALIQRIPVMIGFTANEGRILFNDLQLKDGISEQEKNRMLRTYVRNVFAYHRQKIYDVLANEYQLSGGANPKTLQKRLEQLIGDGQYIAPALKVVSYLKSAYIYYFSKGPRSTHGSDLPYIFGAPLNKGIGPFRKKFDANDAMVSEAMIRYYSNFAWTGDPNKTPKQKHYGQHTNKTLLNSQKAVHWHVHTKLNPQFLQIDSKLTVHRIPFKKTRISTWNVAIEKLRLSSGSSAAKHKLDNSNDMSTFEESGTRPLKLKPLIPPPPFPPYVSQRQTTVSVRPSTTLSTKTTSTVITTVRKFTTSTVPTSTVISNLINDKEEVSFSTMSLSITIAVGCSLLFINVIVFASFLYQREKLWKELKRRQRELEERERVANSGLEESDRLTIAPSPKAPVKVTKYYEINHHSVQRSAPPSAYQTLSRTTAIPFQENCTDGFVARPVTQV